jgi:hypothetical protein
MHLTKLFQGIWRGDEKLRFGGVEETAVGSWTVRAALDGHVLLVDYVEEQSGRAVYSGHGVHTWDKRENTYKSFWYDDKGGIQISTQAALEGNTYRYVGNDGPLGRAHFTYVFHDDSFDFTIAYTKDGTTFETMHEGRYQRTFTFDGTSPSTTSGAFDGTSPSTTSGAFDGISSASPASHKP